MPKRQPPKPSLHKGSGQAVVRLSGKDVYLGKFGSEQAQRAYDDVLARWLANGRQLPEPSADTRPTVTSLCIAYMRHSEAYYRRPDGSATGEVEQVRYVLKRLRAGFGAMAAEDFGPRSLIAFRETLIDSGLCRSSVNTHIGRVRRMFKWCAAQELVDHGVYQALTTVDGLRKGRSAAKETKRVEPVSEADYRAVLPHLPPTVRAIVRVLWYSGCRVGELLPLTTGDLDRSGELWRYTPSTHKNSYRDQHREIVFGKRAQAVLRPFLKADPSAVLFSPREAEDARHVAQRAARKTPMTPSQQVRKRVRSPKRQPGERYSAASVRRAIARACDSAKVPRWTTHRLRHSAGTRIRDAFDLEHAQASLGHASLHAAQIYSEVSRRRAEEAMRALG